ncbi:glycerophosphodiester phosphodiesterase [Bernardetia sp. ABR2-2B]|uniref:glycerophosphodiester phosphodiesterase n=1 Tax=Bernardetia sp. ABR2-2B TaxID=3127472 RepID=UPI0030CD8AA7
MKKVAKYIVVIIVAILVTIILLGGGFGDKEKIVMNNGNPILFAHRGVTESNIENSVDAFDKSKALGFSAIETDISRTKDGKLIIFHDDKTKRLLNIDKNINELYWEEVKDKYLYYNGKETKNKVLSLEQFLSRIDESTILYLDIKESSKVVADSILFLMEKYKDNKNIIIADANIFFLIYLETKNPKLITGLEGFNKGKEWLYYLLPKNFKPDFYSSFIRHVDKSHMLFLKNNDLLNNRIVYGVNNENMSDVLELGLHNVIFDYDSKTDTSDVKSIELRLAKNKMQ